MHEPAFQLPQPAAHPGSFTPKSFEKFKLSGVDLQANQRATPSPQTTTHTNPSSNTMSTFPPLLFYRTKNAVLPMVGLAVLNPYLTDRTVQYEASYRGKINFSEV
jgi:hypothetical protein